MLFDCDSDSGDERLVKSVRSDRLGRKHVTLLGNESPEPLLEEDIAEKKGSATSLGTVLPPMDVFDAATDYARSVEVESGGLAPFCESFLQWLKEKNFHGVYFESKERELTLEKCTNRDFTLCVYAYFCAVYHDLDKALLHMKHILKVKSLEYLTAKIAERKSNQLVSDVERIHEVRKKNGMDIVRKILPEKSVHIFQPAKYLRDGELVERLFLCGGPDVPVVIGLVNSSQPCDFSCCYVCRIKGVSKVRSSEGFFYADVDVVDCFVRT